jgi:hypothetical protein
MASSSSSTTPAKPPARESLAEAEEIKATPKEKKVKRKWSTATSKTKPSKRWQKEDLLAGPRNLLNLWLKGTDPKQCESALALVKEKSASSRSAAEQQVLTTIDTLTQAKTGNCDWSVFFRSIFAVQAVASMQHCRALTLCLQTPSDAKTHLRTTTTKDEPDEVNGAYGEIFPAELFNAEFAKIWQNSNLIADLGMGRGYVLLQMLLWFQENFRDVKLMGYDIFETYFAQSKSFMQSMKSYFDLWHSDTSTTATLVQLKSPEASTKTESHPMQEIRVETKNAAGVTFLQTLQTFNANGLNAKTNVEHIDFFIFDIIVPSNAREAWKAFFLQAKKGARVLCYDTYEIFDAKVWQKSSLRLRTTWGKSGYPFQLMTKAV